MDPWSDDSDISASSQQPLDLAHSNIACTNNKGLAPLNA
jgi:hypothetical protein